MCIVVVQTSVQKCTRLDYTRVPNLLTVHTKIDPKRSKMIKKSTKKTHVYIVSKYLKLQKCVESWTLQRAFQITIHNIHRPFAS